MTPEEKQLIIDSAKKLQDISVRLNSFLEIYYQTNFPDLMVVTKDLEVTGTFTQSGNFTVAGELTLTDGANIVLGTTTGTKFGTATSQKIGFLGVTPITRQSAITAPLTPSATYSQVEAQSTVDAVNYIRGVLQAFGFTA